VSKHALTTERLRSTWAFRYTLGRAAIAAGLAASLFMVPASGGPLAGMLETPVVAAAPDYPHEPGDGNCPPMISRGAKGETVREAQQRLNTITSSWGWQSIDVDGDFGEKTERRVKSFQNRMVLDDDGIVGPRTWHKLGAC
jgi:peptidoglycan hydrolase-like protein with peptidoglycan-binding domain